MLARLANVLSIYKPQDPRPQPKTVEANLYGIVWTHLIFLDPEFPILSHFVYVWICLYTFSRNIVWIENVHIFVKIVRELGSQVCTFTYVCQCPIGNPRLGYTS